MARPLRIEYEGALYHITSRGNARGKIFLDDVDRRRFLEVLSLVVKRYGWLVHAYCLMPNHYHLLVETPGADLSLGMRQLNGVYTQAFNRLHKRVGHIFQGRFKAVLVEKEGYLLELSRYVVLNPVRARMVEELEDWKWSSYRAMLGLGEVPGFLHLDWLLSQFSSDAERARGRYREFVEAGKGVKSPLKRSFGGWILGGKQFLKEVGVRLERKPEKGAKEIPRRERYATRPTLQEIFERKSRDEGVYEAVYRWGYKSREVGDYLGRHYSLVSKILSHNSRFKT